MIEILKILFFQEAILKEEPGPQEESLNTRNENIKIIILRNINNTEITSKTTIIMEINQSIKEEDLDEVILEEITVVRIITTSRIMVLQSMMEETLQTTTLIQETKEEEANGEVEAEEEVLLPVNSQAKNHQNKKGITTVSQNKNGLNNNESKPRPKYLKSTSN